MPEMRFILDYEVKGADIWYILSATQDGINKLQVGRGIVDELLWDQFLDLYIDPSGILRVELVQVK